jgi:hypothetical protein
LVKCEVHAEFFDDYCLTCRQEYLEMKGSASSVSNASNKEIKKYKEFTEERAKRLYEELLLQYINTGINEVQADKKAKAIIKKQCSIRGLSYWDWL